MDFFKTLYDKKSAFDISMVVNGNSPLFLYPSTKSLKPANIIISTIEEKISKKENYNVFLVSLNDLEKSDLKLDIKNSIVKIYRILLEKFKNDPNVNMVCLYDYNFSRSYKSLYVLNVLQVLDNVYKNLEENKINIFLMPFSFFLFLGEKFENIENSEVYTNIDIYYSESVFCMDLYCPVTTDIDILSKCFKNFDIMKYDIEFFGKKSPLYIENSNLMDLLANPLEYEFVSPRQYGSGVPFEIIEDAPVEILNENSKKLYNLLSSSKYNVYILSYTDKVRNKKEDYFNPFFREILFCKRKDLSQEIFMQAKDEMLLKLRFSLVLRYFIRTLQDFSSINIIFGGNIENYSDEQNINITLHHIFNIAVLHSAEVGYIGKYNIFLHSFSEDGFYYVNPFLNKLGKIKEKI